MALHKSLYTCIICTYTIHPYNIINCELLQCTFLRIYLIYFTFKGPLVRIKQALTRLKSDVSQMELRIGVVSILSIDVVYDFHGFLQLRDGRGGAEILKHHVIH
jgi:hypothetical protein